MNSTAMQRWIDALLDTTRQGWLLIIVAVVTPTTAVMVAAAANQSWWPFGVAIVVLGALASTVRPDSQAATLVIGVIVWHWLATVDDVATPWLPVAAACLLAYHSVISLMASIPIGGSVSSTTLLVWTQRFTLGSAMTLAMWLLVVVFERRDAAGNGAMTALALAVVAIAAAVIRSRGLGPTSRPQP